MILILSHSQDYSTDKIVSHLNSLHVKCIRFDVDQFFFNSHITISLSNNSINDEFIYFGHKISFEEIKVVWNRKWDVPSVFKSKVCDAQTFRIYDNIVSEIEVINLYLQRKLESKIWINHPKFSAITKIEQLRLASEIGLKIPETCVSSSSSTILDKFGGISKVITKPIANYLEFVDEDKHYITYSQRCNMKYGEHFFPSLFQRLIERAYELRVFVFQEHIFPMMIFCDEDNDNIDIRYKNYEKRTTYSSCSLSENLSQSLLLFMKKSQIQTGSFDLIVDQIGDTYFIEINPFGQFDFVSQNCNYQIEKHIACKLYEEYKKTL